MRPIPKEPRKAWKWHNGKNVKCKVCGKEVYFPKSRLGIRKYCSKECAKKDNYGFKPLMRQKKGDSKMSEASKAIIHRWPKKKKYEFDVNNRHSKKKKKIKPWTGKAHVFKEEWHEVNPWKGYFIRVEVPARFNNKEVEVTISEAKE